MRIRKVHMLSAVSLFLASCAGNNASVVAEISDMPGKSIVVTSVRPGAEVVLDTLRLDASGTARFVCSLEEGIPDFVYLKTEDGRILADLVLEKGDDVRVFSDSLGISGKVYRVEGSPESERLALLDRKFSEAVSEYEAMTDRFSSAYAAGDEAGMLRARKDIGALYVRTKRMLHREIMENPSSLSSLPQAFRVFPPDIMVFGDNTDAATFRTLYDSLSAEYPSSPYMPVLYNEYMSRMEAVAIVDRIADAEVAGFPDIVLPDVNSVARRLSDIKGKVVLLFFWTSDMADQLMFNQELRKLYDRYSPEGLEIYQVSLDIDKTAWATVVRSQGMPWINVCDGLGSASPAAEAYNVNSVPAGFIIDRSGTLVKRCSAGTVWNDVARLL